MSETLSDVATIVRSKNAGPTLLTIDIFFNSEADYARGEAALTRDRVAVCTGRPVDSVEVIPYPPAQAVKIVLPRPVRAGSPGDRDAYGAQQGGPLLNMVL